jgi:phosphoribosylamine--glycine ligase
MIDEKHGPRVVEYNVRFGDPECQVIMTRLKDDPLPQFLACAIGGLAGCARLERFSDPPSPSSWRAQAIPASRKKAASSAISKKPANVPASPSSTPAPREGDNIIANGGRVLTVTATAPTLQDAVARAYEAVDTIDWPDGFCRATSPGARWRVSKDTSFAAIAGMHARRPRI